MPTSFSQNCEGTLFSTASTASFGRTDSEHSENGLPNLKNPANFCESNASIFRSVLGTQDFKIGNLGGGSLILKIATLLAERSAEKLAILPKNQPNIAKNCHK